MGEEIILNEWGNHFKWTRKRFVHFFSLFRLIPTIPTTTATQLSPKALRQMEPREPSSSTPWYRIFCWNGAVQQWHSQVPEMSEEDIRKAVEPLLLEYFDNGDCDEVFIGWHELQITLLFQVLNTLEEMLLNIGTRRWRSLWYGKWLDQAVFQVDGASSGHRAGSRPQTQPQGDDQQAHLGSLPQGNYPGEIRPPFWQEKNKSLFKPTQRTGRNLCIRDDLADF